MAIRKKEELMEVVRGYTGNDQSDNALALLEDLADTLADLEGKIGEDWKKKYEENDNAWREKYKERFFNTPGEPGDKLSGEPGADETEEPLTYERLFEEKEV